MCFLADSVYITAKFHFVLLERFTQLSPTTKDHQLGDCKVD